MQVIADNLSAIRDLADRQEPTDLTMRRLQDFVNLQSFACLWGLVPGSLTDERSPFNECAHSYLAALRRSSSTCDRCLRAIGPRSKRWRPGSRPKC